MTPASVLEPGVVTPGDELRLIHRPHPDWPLARLLHHLFVDRMNADALHAIAALAVLPPSFRNWPSSACNPGKSRTGRAG